MVIENEIWPVHDEPPVRGRKPAEDPQRLPEWLQKEVDDAERAERVANRWRAGIAALAFTVIALCAIGAARAMGAPL